MRRRSAVPPAPLPQRHGIDPVRLRLPWEGPWVTVRDHLVERLPVPAELIDAMFAEGAVHGVAGPLAVDAPFVPGAHLWYHRELAPETPVPFPLTVLHRDERILVVDKPHFLAMTPRGRHVTETALAKLRRELDLPALSPAHRLDRLTAGLALFVLRPELRGAYQGLFQDRLVRKAYRAVAPFRPELELPRTVRSRILKERGELAAREVPGEPNSESRVELLDHRAGLGLYRLLPHTGRTHQLRLHLCSLGIPILGDPLYPEVLPETAPDDFRDPLQLLAAELEFTDPVTGVELSFRSRLELSAWPTTPKH
ncbi:pseudouridylate synthase [Kitasatospora sp. MMS16-BH015]|uniref:pseudouridine synthase n=1 Tax=Kitasatospora sp. MMS16-BH015 TaxID=2018025 RepID=UPI000CA2AEC6|nr:pseudouridine synthase [Kitasatospora sp. MMS16-BH015]AUG82160.1 pseudouridylate synthase [Kitasatospora sp. MMS16-BH015]